MADEPPVVEGEAETCNLAWPQALALPALWSLIVGVVLTLMLYCLRRGFAENSLPLELTFFGAGCFLLTLPAACWQLARVNHHQPQSPVLQCAPFAAVPAALVVFGVLGRYAPGAGFIVVRICAAAGGIMGVWQFGRSARALGLWRTLFAVVLALITGLYISGFMWGRGSGGRAYQNPLLFSYMGLTADAGMYDLILHSAILEMIKTYHVCSTGLDGVPPVQYHYGSHWLFGQWSALFGISGLDFYNLAYPVIFIPVYIFYVILAALACGGCVRRKPGCTAFGMLLIAALLISLPPKSIFRNIWEVEWIWISQSYCVSVMLSLALIGVIVTQRRWLLAPVASGGAVVRYALVPLASLLVFFAVGITKISQIALLVPAACYLVARLRLFRADILVSLAGAMAGAGLAALMTTNRDVTSSTIFTPFIFVRDLGLYWAMAMYAFYWAPGFVYAVLRVRSEQLTARRSLWDEIMRRKFVDVEVLILMTLLGALPGVLTGGWAFWNTLYFMDFPRVLGFVFVVGLCLQIPERAGAAAASVALPVPDARLLKFGLGVCMLSCFCYYTAGRLGQVLRLDGTSRGQPQFDKTVTSLLAEGAFGALLAKLDSTAKQAEAAYDVPGHSIYELRKLNALPREEKARSVVFVPRHNRRFWDLIRKHDYPEGCTPLLVPAISGMAELSGWPEGDPQRRMSYSFYSIRGMTSWSWGRIGARSSPWYSRGRASWVSAECMSWMRRAMAPIPLRCLKSRNRVSSGDRAQRTTLQNCRCTILKGWRTI